MFLGITPDCKVRIREDILKEEDGPMLRYALQGLHNSRIYLPRKPELRPDPERLLQRYREFNEFRAVA